MLEIFQWINKITKHQMEMRGEVVQAEGDIRRG